MKDVIISVSLALISAFGGMYLGYRSEKKRQKNLEKDNST